MKKIVVNLLVMGLASAFTLCLLEGAVRLYHAVRYDVPFLSDPAGGAAPAPGGRLSPLSPDAVFGWRSTPGYRSTDRRTSLDGRAYTADISFDSRGFRVFGDVESLGRKVFVIGDSFTQAIHVSDGKTYYELLGRQLDTEIFAYGAGGFGTLQEYLVFKEYFDEIQPDLVLWQMAANDCINNLARLEAQSRLNNNRMVRPFWEEGRIVYRMADLAALRLEKLGLQRSRLLSLLITRWDRHASARAEKRGDSIEFEIERRGKDHPLLQQSAAIVADLLERARRQAGSVPIVTFLSDHRGANGEPYEHVFQEAARRSGVRHAAGVGRAIAEAHQAGQVVYYRDGAHWNERGHELAAELLVRSLSD